MGKYAEDTAVPTSRSQEEIARTLQRFGCTKTMWMRDDDLGIVVLAFTRGRLTYKLTMPLPKATDPTVRFTATRGFERTKEQQRVMLDQETRRRFRSLANYTKAVLDAAQSGIISLEDALMPYAILPGGATVAEHIQPRIQAMLESGQAPDIALALPSGR